MALQDWARGQISRLLPLDDESIEQLVTYSSSLPPEEAASHLKTLLGDSPQALEFISSFNSRRASTASKSTTAIPTREDGVPKSRNKNKKTKDIHHLPEVRRPDNYGDTSGAYRKREDEEYMPATNRPRSRDGTPGGSPARHGPRSSSPVAGTSSHRTEAFSNLLDPSMPNVHTRTGSPGRKANNSTPSPISTPRTASPAKHSTSTKVAIAGGTPMHGASSTLADLDAAIRALEVSTNPTISQPSADSRRCDCMGSIHPLLASAPNCLHCGKVVCLKEGLAPCTFCGAALLSSEQVQEMVRALREERGRERMAAHNATKQRPEVSTTPKPFTTPRTSGAPGALEQAQAHRDRLLGFQASNAARTRVIDEASHFETPDMGVSQWGSAVQRATQLKRQQAALRELEWNARPEYEKRRMVVSVDIVKGKVVKKMGPIEREQPREPEEEASKADVEDVNAGQRTSGAGAFSHNPLLGALIRPVWHAEPEETGIPAGESAARDPAAGQLPRQWRRVQDDANNESIILDGGAYGENERR